MAAGRGCSGFKCWLIGCVTSGRELASQDEKGCADVGAQAVTGFLWDECNKPAKTKDAHCQQPVSAVACWVLPAHQSPQEPL